MDEKRWERNNYRNKFYEPQECKVKVEYGVEFIYYANHVEKKYYPQVWCHA